MTAYRGRHRRPTPNLSVRFWCVVFAIPLLVSACTPRHTVSVLPASPGMATVLDHNLPSTAAGACHADCGVTP